MINNEIKEILDFKENADYKRLSCDEIKVLRDYITNLQEEYKHLSQSYYDLHEKYYKLQDYKSRIEKAVEYMKKHIEKCNIDGYEGKFDNFDIFTKPQKLLNILNGKE